MSTQPEKKQKAVNQLKHFRNSINSIKSFLKTKDTEEVGCCECGSPACLWGKYDQFAMNAPSSAESGAIQDNNAELSNVVFTPGSYTESTEVYVDGIKLTGVSKASLEYDAEMGVPVLKLEIIAPQIQANIL
jgi:hypothetical protein